MFFSRKGEENIYFPRKKFSLTKILRRNLVWKKTIEKRKKK